MVRYRDKSFCCFLLHRGLLLAHRRSDLEEEIYDVATKTDYYFIWAWDRVEKKVGNARKVLVSRTSCNGSTGIKYVDNCYLI